MTLKNHELRSVMVADQLLGIAVGKSTGRAPDTVDLISAFAAATDIGIGVTVVGADAVGVAAEEVLGDDLAVGLDESQPVVTATRMMASATATTAFRMTEALLLVCRPARVDGLPIAGQTAYTAALTASARRRKVGEAASSPIAAIAAP
jgi:hypothetical protein